MNPVKSEKEQEKTPVVLVVDDNQQNLELLQAYLEDMKCETIPAYDGQEALEVISRGAPCLLYTSPSPRDRTRSRMPSSA